ncbi:putative uncharacterized protein DDB_G0294196 [Sorghum bicolor]|uniref:putative uncharacterized protein DDB_G0294196 n=1 Tax=Sorghum bicolor TaxID=4558 RepID=UPI000B4268C7|nr:putative uncharacterized protein DDB_G0294196 [Sorghum bicolor]|eukprot:XP_021311872.1 putative uncharacterized protein DDB_G0294196 [Sorghum bicolor]
MYGVVQVHQSRLDPLLDALKRLREEGLTAALILSAVHYRRGSIDVRSSRPPVKEDEVNRDKRRESAEKQKLKRTLEEAQPSMAKRLKAGAASKESGSPDPWPSTGAEDAPPRPMVGEPIPPSLRRVEVTRPQEQEGAPEPPRSGVEGDPITISDGSGGDGPSKDARPMDEGAETSLVAKRTPWPVGLRSVEEQRKKEEEEREQETRQQPQEGQQPESPQLDELLEQDRQQELRQLQEQQQQRGKQLEELLEPPFHGPPHPVPAAP